MTAGNGKTSIQLYNYVYACQDLLNLVKNSDSDILAYSKRKDEGSQDMAVLLYMHWHRKPRTTSLEGGLAHEETYRICISVDISVKNENNPGCCK